MRDKGPSLLFFPPLIILFGTQAAQVPVLVPTKPFECLRYVRIRDSRLKYPLATHVVFVCNEFQVATTYSDAK